MVWKQMTSFEAFADMCQRCYPGMEMNSKEDKDNFIKHREIREKEGTVRHYGWYERDELIAGYVEYDHKMNVYDSWVSARGIGTVAVDLPHKKKGHAKKLITKFIMDARDQGYPLVHLYPFKPAFYKKMGFGLGPSLFTYRFSPDQLPSRKHDLSLRKIGKDDLSYVQNVYQEWAERTHGSNKKAEFEFSFLEKDDIHTYGVEENGELQGYVSYKFESSGHFLLNDLNVINFVAPNQNGYDALIQHLYSQKDQVRMVHFPTFDPYFSHLLKEPGHEDAELIYAIYHKMSDHGNGLMYKIVDVRKFFETIAHHSFSNVNVVVKWRITDSLLDEVTELTTAFVNGKPQETEQGHEVSVDMGIGEFSSLMMGCLTFEACLKMDTVQVTGDLEKVKTLFRSPISPESWTFF